MTIASVRTRPSLDDLLFQARRDSVEFPYLLANHAPMILVALDRMGASSERIEQWYWRYHEAHGLPPAPAPVVALTQRTWREALGDRSREADARAFFVAEVERSGIDATIRGVLPDLLQGVAGSATHPLMRLAYGVLRQDKAEVGTALGYWVSCYLPLPDPGGAKPDTDDPGAVLAAMADVEGIRDVVPETDLLWHTIRAVGALPGFAPAVDRLAVTHETPRRMAQTALALYAGTMDFSALHAVTGLHWARLVGAHLDDPKPLYRAFWQVVAALVPKIGFPDLPSTEALADMRRTEAPGWDEIRRVATGSDDEHDVSLVFSAWQEEAIWRDPLYRVVAARRVGLIA